MTRPLSPAPAAVLFDLDGTLVDSAPGITSGIAAALAAHDVAVPGQPVLDAMVGPPLASSLLSVPGVDETNLAGIIDHYRRDYVARGLADAAVFPGLTELLDELRAAGTALAVATSKPQTLAERLISRQGLRERLDVVVGSDPDETRPHPGKAAIVGEALQALGLGPGAPRTAMVGDRIFDVEGARGNDLPCIGVRWGSAPDGELEEAGAAPVVDDVAGLREALRRIAATESATESATGPGDAAGAETAEAAEAGRRHGI
ncbi:HAD hydrolase-like protein [Nesterenkonia sp. F]|uniref:HAD hydrolase-like protein n=1 Tax=Nesterenkonia sp. F TaxID=795955 RepID=UPI000255D283|nr:HAD hydrolase-like protein [Nesterenkonia sp. F]